MSDRGLMLRAGTTYQRHRRKPIVPAKVVNDDPPCEEPGQYGKSSEDEAGDGDANHDMLRSIP